MILRTNQNRARGVLLDIKSYKNGKSRKNYKKVAMIACEHKWCRKNEKVAMIACEHKWCRKNEKVAMIACEHKWRRKNEKVAMIPFPPPRETFHL